MLNSVSRKSAVGFGILEVDSRLVGRIMYCPFDAQATPLAEVRSERFLPAPGEVLVGVGERVEPERIVGQTSLSGGFHVLSVARMLGVPASQTARYLRVQTGDPVRKGQLVAKRGGLAFRSVKSPIDGSVTAIGRGRMLLETEPRLFELKAYIPGVVTRVLADHGVVIETTGAIIQGAWGTGGESSGVVKCLTDSSSQPLEPSMIDPSCHGAIIVGGMGLTNDVFEQAEAFQIRGIVIGGLEPGVLAGAQEMTCPVVVTEGMGAVAMSEPLFRLLQTNDGREASISGEMRVKRNIVRPEIIIPLPTDVVPPAQVQPGAPFTVGSRVRLTRAPNMGAAGKIVDLPSRARVIETGARVKGAIVDLGEQELVFVPLANLEILR